jgi:hypothetical protein
MFRLMNAITMDRTVGPQISFIVAFIEETIKCGQQYSKNMTLYDLHKCMVGGFSRVEVYSI